MSYSLVIISEIKGLVNVKGRLRPDFLARCSWDDVLGKCIGQVPPTDRTISIYSFHSVAFLNSY